jgi:hypothetical protein
MKETQDIETSFDLMIPESEDMKELQLERDIEEDLSEARETYKDLIEKGKEGLDLAYDVVEGTQHPNAVASFATLLNSLAALNKNLVDLQTVKRESLKKKAKENSQNAQGSPLLSGAQNTLNQVFIGSPKDLQELIQGMNTNGLRGLAA